MAHKKAGGSKARQGLNVKGKRLGLKFFGGQIIKTGQIIMRQRGTKIHAGPNVGLGKDHTLFALIDGILGFRHKTNQKKEAFVTPKQA